MFAGLAADASPAATVVRLSPKPLILPEVPSMVIGLAAFLPTVILSARPKSIWLSDTVVTMFLSTLVYRTTSPGLTWSFVSLFARLLLSAVMFRPFCNSMPMLSNAPCTVLAATEEPSDLVTLNVGAAILPSALLKAAPKAAASGLSWLTLAASVSFLPAATEVIVLPPLLRPSEVSFTGLAAVPTVTPAALTVVVLPEVSVKAAESKPFSAFASLTSNVPWPSETTPMLLSLNLSVSVSPPLTVTVLPNCLVAVAPVSPAKFSGLLTASLRAENALSALS